MDPSQWNELTPDEYADQILGECDQDDSIDLSKCESLDEELYSQNYDEDDEYENELHASGEYPYGFDNPEDLDDDFLI